MSNLSYRPGRLAWPAVALVVVGCDSGDSRSSTPAAESAAIAGPRRERRIDLLERLDEARIDVPRDARQPRLQSDEAINSDRDDPDLEVARGTSITFDDVPLYAGASLHYEVGARQSDQGTLPTGYRCAIRCAVAGSAPITLLDCEISSADGSSRRSGTLDLATFAPGAADLTFEVSAPRGRDRVAWSRLFVDSEGRAERPVDRNIAFESIVHDFAVEDDGAATLPSSIRIAVPGAWTQRVAVPPAARLRIGGALIGAPTTVTARFRVDFDGEPLARFERSGGDPRTVASQRETLELGALAGRTGIPRVSVESAAAVPGELHAELVQPQLCATRTIERRQRASPFRDVFFIVVDTLRADALGCYGAPTGSSPNLDRFAATALVFDRAESPSSWTLPATASLLTGLPVETHGVRGPGQTYLLDAHETLAERLQGAGYTTAGFVANTLISATASFDQGFESWHTLPWMNARKVLTRASRWLDDHPTERVFAYLHLVDPHTPYNAPIAAGAPGRDGGDGSDHRTFRALMDEFLPKTTEHDFANLDDADFRAAVARSLALYRDEVRFVDRWLGWFFDELKRTGRFDDALIVVTADHGEEFLEHSLLFHGSQLYRETVGVPLLLRGPGVAPGRMAELFGSHLIAPLLEGLATAPERDGADRLLERLAPESVVMATEIASVDDRLTTRRAIVRGTMKLIVNEAAGTLELYDLRADPTESRDLSAELPQVADELAELLARQLAAQRRVAPSGFIPADDETREQLRDLGYVR